MTWLRRKAGESGSGEKKHDRLLQLLRLDARRLASQDVAQTIAELEPLLEEDGAVDRGPEAVWYSLWIAISEKMPTGGVEYLLSHTRTAGSSLEAK